MAREPSAAELAAVLHRVGTALGVPGLRHLGPSQAATAIVSAVTTREQRALREIAQALEMEIPGADGQHPTIAFICERARDLIRTARRIQSERDDARAFALEQKAEVDASVQESAKAQSRIAFLDGAVSALQGELAGQRAQFAERVAEFHRGIREEQSLCAGVQWDATQQRSEMATRLVRAEQQVQEISRDLEAHVSAACDAISKLDPGGKLVLYNGEETPSTPEKLALAVALSQKREAGALRLAGLFMIERDELHKLLPDPPSFFELQPSFRQALDDADTTIEGVGNCGRIAAQPNPLHGQTLHDDDGA